MISKKTSRILFIVLFVVLGIACDQVSKIIVRQNVGYNEQTEVFGRYIILTKVENTGAFLSLGDSLPKPLYLLLMILLPIAVLGYVLYYMFKNDNLLKIRIIGLCLILIGGFGNIIDRILFGSVTDFLFFDFVLFHTGIVNLADIMVTAGVLFILYEIYVLPKLKKT